MHSKVVGHTHIYTYTRFTALSSFGSEWFGIALAIAIGTLEESGNLLNGADVLRIINID